MLYNNLNENNIFYYIDDYKINFKLGNFRNIYERYYSPNNNLLFIDPNYNKHNIAGDVSMFLDFIIEFNKNYNSKDVTYYKSYILDNYYLDKINFNFNN